MKLPVLFALVLASLPAFAQQKEIDITPTPAAANIGQQKTLKELIVGTWILDSVYDQTQDGTKNNPWGPDIKGQAIFDGNGRLSWQMISADRSKTASNNPRMPVGQALAYFGTYTVDDAAKTATFHIERCTFPQWDEIDSTLNIAFPTENELNVTTAKPIQDGTSSFVPHLNFKRAMAAQTAKDLVGTWTLASVYIEGPDGSRFDPFGTKPTGILIMDGNGHISVQFIGSGLPKFASNNRQEGTPEENKAVVQGTLTYFGSYSLSDADRTLNIHIESSSYPNWSGVDQKRFLTLTGDEMGWNNPTASTGPGFTGHVVWKRAK